MAACVPITNEQIRAEVWFGQTLIAKTPYVLSFNVTKSRTSTSNTFTVQLELMGGLSFPLGEKLTIKAGIRDNLKNIFTGVVKQTRVEPSLGKPSYYKLTLSGEGVLAELTGKKFTRRLRTDGQGLYCLITGGPSNRPDAFYSLDGKKEAGNKQFLSPSYDPTKTGRAGENSPLIVNSNNTNAIGGGTAAGGIAVEPKDGGQKQDGGLDIHDHADMTKGGPAFGTYSSD